MRARISGFARFEDFQNNERGVPVKVRYPGTLYPEKDYGLDYSDGCFVHDIMIAQNRKLVRKEFGI